MLKEKSFIFLELKLCSFLELCQIIDLIKEGMFFYLISFMVISVFIFVVSFDLNILVLFILNRVIFLDQRFLGNYNEMLQFLDELK